MAEHDYRSAKTYEIAHRTSGQSNDEAHLTPHASTEQYEKLYKESIDSPNQFWDRVRLLSHLLARVRAKNWGARDSPRFPTSRPFTSPLRICT